MQTLRRCLFPLLVLVPLIGSGLPTTTHAAAEAPIHFHLLCPEREDGQSVACDSMMRLAHVTAWGKDALSRPNSTFTIWSVGPERAGSRLFFAACVPPRWGASVLKAKAAFMAMAREGASGSQSGRVVPERCQPPGPKHPGSHQLEVAVSASTPHSDVWQQVAVGTGGPPLHLAVVCDRSDSTAGAACTPSALLAAFDRWVAEGLMLPGGSLSVEMVGTSQYFLSPVFMLTVPDLPLGERVAFVLGGRGELARLLTDSSEQYASTIAEAVSAAVSRLRERRGRYELLVLSDLLQITSGVWNFAYALPEPHDFLVWLKKARVAPDLRDIPVLACGMHTGQAPSGNGPYTASFTARLADLWDQVFQALGAKDVKLFRSCDAGFAALDARRISHE